MRRIHRLIFAVVVAGFTGLGLGHAAQASMLAYELQGKASGDLGGATFTDASFTLFGTADSASASVFTSATVVLLPSPTITIAGVGTLFFTEEFGFTGLTHPFGSSGSPFYVSALGGVAVDLIDFSDPNFHTWDYLSPFGPEAVTFFDAGGLGTPPQSNATSGGALFFTNASDLVFSVTRIAAVPEPASAILVLSGMLLLAAAAALGLHRKTTS